MTKNKNTVINEEGFDTKVLEETALKIEPMLGKVFVFRKYRDETTNSKIYVHNRKKEQTPFAIVLASNAMGEDFLMGQTVVVFNHCGTDVTIKGSRMTIVDESDIQAIYNNDADENIFNDEHNNAAATKVNSQRQKGTYGKEHRE